MILRTVIDLCTRRALDLSRRSLSRPVLPPHATVARVTRHMYVDNMHMSPQVTPAFATPHSPRQFAKASSPPLPRLLFSRLVSIQLVTLRAMGLYTAGTSACAR